MEGQTRSFPPTDAVRTGATITQGRLPILNSWLRNHLQAGNIAPLVGLSKHTLKLGQNRFAQNCPVGLGNLRGASKGQAAKGYQADDRGAQAVASRLALRADPR